MLRLYVWGVKHMTLFRNKYRIESNRKKDWDYTSRGWYFVTICTAGKVCVLGQVKAANVILSPIGKTANDFWSQIPKHHSNVHLDEFIVMPNHVHGIVIIEGEHVYSPDACLTSKNNSPRTPPQPNSLGAIVRSYKSGVARWCHQNGFPDFQWQSRYHDYIIRSHSSLTAVRDYIQNNPANWEKDKHYVG